MEQLTVKHLTKSFGRHTVLDDISFTLEPAKIYGLLGRNGAGKSTLLNIMTNRIFMDDGQLMIGKEEIDNNDDALSKMYLMSEVDMYPKHTSLRQMFDLADSAYGNFDYQTADRMLKEFELNDKEILTNLSTGQRTLAQLVVALNVNADYVLMDEPVLGLDANHREMFYRELIKSYQSKPRTFVLSTHLIEEIEQMIEHVIILDRTKIIVDSPLDDLMQKAYAISGPAQEVDDYISGLNILTSETLGNIKTNYVLDQLDDQKVIPDRVKIDHYDLQHLFIYLTQGGGKND